MDVEHLVTMANQIADFFDSELGPEEAPKGIALHVSRYWDPRMRRAIVAKLADGEIELDPLVRKAVERLGSRPPA